MTFVESPGLPQFQTAVVAQGPGKLGIQHNVPIPTLTSDMALVKTAAVAINPADAKMLDYSAAPGAIHGYDFAGTVVALGENVRVGLTVGDRMAGFVHGMNCLQPEIGAFAEYVGATADLLLNIPDSLSFEEAATYVSLEPFRVAVTQTRPTVEPSWLMVLSLFGHEVAVDGDYARPARPEYRQFGAEAFAAVQALLDRGLIDTHPTKIMAGGWDGVIEGVALIRSQAPSGSKLVYSV